jgi:hypothetical protein
LAAEHSDIHRGVVVTLGTPVRRLDYGFRDTVRPDDVMSRSRRLTDRESRRCKVLNLAFAG